MVTIFGLGYLFGLVSAPLLLLLIRWIGLVVLERKQVDYIDPSRRW